MYFFIHIPKTAGTSFRIAAERHFGRERIVYDYGQHSTVTSACVQSYLYQKDKLGMQPLVDYWQHNDVTLIAGHKPLRRFSGVVGLPRTFTFVRDPLERCFSEYLHFQRDGRFAGTFREFFINKGSRGSADITNPQLKYLSGMPLQALGFVGVTERYRESLGLLNALYGWKISHRKLNKSGFLAPSASSISDDDRVEFAQLNAADIALYQSACHLLDQRLYLHAGAKPFVHGGYEQDSNGRTQGWAWWAGAGAEEGPVELELWEGNHCIEVVVADIQHKTLARACVPRAGRVGFSNNNIVKNAVQPMRVRVRSTGQWLKPTGHLPEDKQ